MALRYSAFVEPIYPLGDKLGEVGPQFPATTKAIERPSGKYACPARGPGEWALAEIRSWAGDNQSSLVILKIDPNGDISERGAYEGEIGGL